MNEKQLNKRIGELADENDLLVRINKRLKEENEQLRKDKSTLNKALELSQYQLKVQDRIIKEYEK